MSHVQFPNDLSAVSMPALKLPQLFSFARSLLNGFAAILVTN